MKKAILMTAFMLIIFLMGSINTQAQEKSINNPKSSEQFSNDEIGNQQPGMNCNIPGLTDSQRETLTKMRLEHQKMVQQMRAGIQEKRAHLNSLRLADKYNKGEVNSTIDEIAALRASLMKANEAHRQNVRAELNDEQKAWFDSRPNQGQGFGRGPDCNGDGPHRFSQNKGFRQGKGKMGCDGTGPQGRRGNRGFNSGE